MMDFVYRQPVEILFEHHGLGKLKELVARYEGEGLLICTPHFVKDGTAERLMKEVPVIHEVFSSISVNPDISEVEECCGLIRKHSSTFLIALGGGSAMDLAKAAGTISQTLDPVDVYFGTGISLPSQHLPLIAIPTTSGTGSEVTNVAVLSNRKSGKKVPMVSDNFSPDIALIDPMLTCSVPPQVTASCGLDVLAHALEAFWSKHHQPICDALALASCERVFQYLFQCYQHPEDEEARTKMSEASLLAGLAFAMPKTTAPHACSYPLTNIYGIPHGEACALTLCQFARINTDERLLQFAQKLGFQDVEDMCQCIERLQKQMKVRMDLKDMDLREDQLKDLITLSHHPNLANNPVEVTDDMLEVIYRSLLTTREI